MKMRAKLVVSSVVQHKSDATGDVIQEDVVFNAVGRSDPYLEDGSDENNTFARFTPSASLEMSILNPALFNKLEAGMEFYADLYETKDTKPKMATKKKIKKKSGKK